MLRPHRRLVLVLVLVAVGLFGAFLASRIAVRADQEQNLAEFQRSESARFLDAGDLAQSERRTHWAEEFEATANSYTATASILGLGSLAFLAPGSVLSLRLYRSRPRSAARDAVGDRAGGGGRRPATAGVHQWWATAQQEGRPPTASSNGRWATGRTQERPSRRQKPMREHRGRTTDVFVSYAREDQVFTKELVSRLSTTSREVWVDWDDIPLTANWMNEIRRAIDGAGTVMFVISPQSATSRVCRAELECAEEAGKRIVPVLRQEPAEAMLPPGIGALNWIWFRPQDDPNVAFQQLVQALDTNLEWVRFHTRLLVRAKEWQDNASDDSLLLGEAELEDAAGRLVETQNRSPDLTALQSTYLAASQYGIQLRQRRQIRGVYLASIAYGLLQPAVTYVAAFDEISESGLIALAPLWLLALAFGASGLMMARPTLAKSGAAAASAAGLLVVLYLTIWPLL